MRFIHLADLHLGAVPDRGCPWSKEREEEIWSTFRRVIAGIREDRWICYLYPEICSTVSRL